MNNQTILEKINNYFSDTPVEKKVKACTINMLSKFPYSEDKLIYIANDEDKAMQNTLYFYNKQADILMWVAAQKEIL